MQARLIIFTEFQKYFSVFLTETFQRFCPTTEPEITTPFRELLRQHPSLLRYRIHLIELGRETFLSSNTAEIHINELINNHHGTYTFLEEIMLEQSFVGSTVMLFDVSLFVSKIERIYS